MASAYWEKRVSDSEANAMRYADKAAARQMKMYKLAYQRIEKELNALYTEIIEQGKTPTRSELWKIKKYLDLQSTIDKTFQELGYNQISLVDSTLKTVFDSTIGSLGLDKTKGAFNLVSREQANQVLNENWSGNTYSNRIWGVNAKISDRVKDDITEMVINGKNPTAVKGKIMDDFGVAYSYADRLIRTETSHIYNEAAKHSYRNAGVEEVEIIREDDCCDECEKLTEVYKLSMAPKLPLHPNCRCCYVPVVDIQHSAADDELPF